MEPLSTEQLDAYLARIGFDRPDGPDLATLAGLQLAHLERVPFENLDIHAARTISLDDDAIFGKVVERRRGGYCYELNSLFARLLVTLGFRPSLVSARVAGDDGFSAEYDHLTLLVTIDGPERWLVDVGFGDAFTAPLPLVDGEVRRDRDRDVRLSRHGTDWWYEEDTGSGWGPSYAFTTRDRDLAAFQERNTWQQASPDSHFTKAPLCSRLTPEGRVTLAGDRLIETVDGARNEKALDPAEARATLAVRFGIELAARPTLAEVDPELLANPTALLATNGRDGHPQLTLVWFLVEDGEIGVSVTDSIGKARNLRRDGRCSVVIANPATPNHYAEIRGFATIEDDHDYEFADRLGARYETDMRTFDGRGARRVRVAIRPQRIVVTDVRS